MYLRRDRRDIFLRIHELLYSDDLQRGRNTLFRKVTDVESIEELEDQEYRDVIRVLGAYNALGLYIKKRYVNEHDVLNTWSESSYRTWKRAQSVRDYREKHEGYRPWDNLDLLAQKARQVLLKKGFNPGSYAAPPPHQSATSKPAGRGRPPARECPAGPGHRTGL